MEFREIVEKLGFEKYPEALDEIYATLANDNTPACDMQLIDELQQDMDMFGPYYEIVKQTAQEINRDPVRSAWVKTAIKFAASNPSTVAKTVPSPKSDGTAVTDLLPLHILIALMPAGIQNYYDHGFSYEEVKYLMNDIQDSIRIVESQVGRPCINALYYGWLMHYVKTEIYDAGGYWFELTTVSPKAMWLCHRKTGEVLCVVCRGTFDGTGSQVEGSKNYEDPTESFTVTVTEDEAKFVGHGVYDNKVSTVAKTYLKSEWECLARPGDRCLSLHIRRNGNISPEALQNAVNEARRIAAERFQERPDLQIHGSSWILNPKLAELLGPESRITQFLERFVKHPQRDRGKSVFGYVFPKNYTDYESLPEDTSLQRKLKKLYIDGDCIHSYAGIIV